MRSDCSLVSFELVSESCKLLNELMVIYFNNGIMNSLLSAVYIERINVLKYQINIKSNNNIETAA